MAVADPLFADPGARDYHLSAESPAIDFCDGPAAGSRPDIDLGERGLDQLSVADRFPGSLFDIGADEFASPDPPVIFADGFESGDASAWSGKPG